jgi:hypothetical protein
MTQTKSFTVRFYSLDVKKIDTKSSLRNLCDEYKHNGNYDFPLINIDNASYHIRSVTQNPADKSISGYIVKYKENVHDSSSLSSLEEKIINLGSDNAFIEKNHFIIFIEKNDSELLAYQHSRDGTTISALISYFNKISEINVVYNDMLTKESLDEIFNKGMIKQVEFKIHKPLSKDYQPNPNSTWTTNAFNEMTQSGATTFSGKIGTNSKTKGLASRVKNEIKQMLNSSSTKSLKVKLSSHSKPIDLFAERIYGRITVHLYSDEDGNTSTINPIEVHSQIRLLKDGNQRHFDSNFNED